MDGCIEIAFPIVRLQLHSRSVRPHSLWVNQWFCDAIALNRTQDCYTKRNPGLLRTASVPVGSKDWRQRCLIVGWQRSLPCSRGRECGHCFDECLNSGIRQHLAVRGLELLDVIAVA